MTVKTYTPQELSATVKHLSQIFDVVRVVNPCECREIHVGDEGVDYGHCCYAVWDKKERCANCVSYCAHETGNRLSKIESDCHVIAAPARIVYPTMDEIDCVIEMVVDMDKEAERIAETGRAASSAAASAVAAKEQTGLSIITNSLNRLDDGIIYFDAAGNPIFANGKAYQFFDIESDLTTLGKSFKEWIHPIERDRDEDKWCQLLMMKHLPHHVEIKHHRLRHHDGEVIGAYYLITDRTDEPKTVDPKHYLSTHDPLTRIFNRTGFYEEARELLNRYTHEQYLIISVDIKDFKLVNDLFSIEKGNEILMKMASELSAYCDDGKDICGRLSGDRFVMCVRESRYDEGELIKSFDQVSDLIESDFYKLFVHAGVFVVADGAMPVSIMTDRARLAQKQVKNEGHNCIARFDEHIMEETLHEKAIIQMFDTALAEKQIQIYLQPQVSASGRLLGAEALARWVHPEQGMIYPNEFIDILERNGLIYKLDQYVWERAAEQLRAWKGTAMEGLYISVNISAKDVYYLDLYKTFTELTKRYDLDPYLLKLEFTETAIMSDVDKYVALVSRLQRFGFEIEIDDFGSGYSSLAMLKDICADVLKLDMSFLDETKNIGRNRVILDAIIQMSKGLGMPTVSEGVETREQLDSMTRLGCDIFQGYYFAKPMPVETFVNRFSSADHIRKIH